MGQASAADWREAWAWKAWAWLNARPALYRIAMRIGRHVRGLTPAWQGGWTAHRTPMRLAARGLRERLAQRGPHE